ncbi:right-handed parallel beta-helix repeat-containing protein [Flavivirga abyssicola]|uniref:right-handed parallel beta-helix repeat-containing protein n=1 Tax=Flavivirga abyssicola TaxID=3063533 RepID=UPI0026DFE82D|nr:right-handed parallel beta-helix repeat-containing protein [Flavivirga sp. MEBiC07777]WVK11671.1 right-handed parallel beta-helix repeat-containing protein [Flavivirga sp. MEBiC07777]
MKTNRMVIFLTFMLFTLVAFAQEVNIYVSKNGNDSNSGSKNKPVATLNAARDLIRNYKSTKVYPSEGFVVWVSAGEYYQNKSFELNELDSGIPGIPIVYRAVEGDQVFLTGGISIAAKNFKKLKSKSIKQRLTPKAVKNIRVADLKALGITDYGTHKQYGHALSVYPAPIELFFNDEPMTIARYPNEGFVQIEEVVEEGSIPRAGDYSERGGIIKYKDERHSLWAGNDDVWFQGTFKNGYADDKLHVEYIDPKKKHIKFSKPHMYGLRSGKKYTHYVALNILDELDMPGEWYVDRKLGKLYFWPTSDINKGTVKISVIEDPVVSIEGACHIVFRDFTVENGRGIGIYMERGSNNVVAGCTVRNFGTTGIFMGQGSKQTVPYITHDHYEGVPISRRVGNYAGHIYKYTTWNRKAGKNNKILSCDVYNTGTGGIVLSGGSKRKLIPGNNVVENCKIHDYNRRNKFRWGGVVVDGCGNKVKHNEIYNSDFQAIFTVGPEHIFEYNNIHHVVMHSDDVSVWYTGRDPSDRGQIIRYNYFHDCGNKERMNMGIYCDDSSGGISVFGNVFYNMHTAHGVLYSNTGWDISMKNNIVINPHSRTVVLSPHYYTWYKGKGPVMFGKDKLFEQRLFKDINILEPPYSERYPKLVNYMDVIKEGEEWEGMHSRRNVLTTNVIVGGKKNPVEIRGGKYGVFENINNYQTDTDPGFVDFGNGNFMLRKDSKVFKKLLNFEPIPFDKMGLYIDEFRKKIN